MPDSKETAYIESLEPTLARPGYFHGYISNYRLTIGQALYTGNFTPPTTQLTTNSVGTTGPNVASTFTGEVKALMFQTYSNVLINNGIDSNITFTAANVINRPVIASIPTPVNYEVDWVNNTSRTQIYTVAPEYIDRIEVGDLIRINDSDTGFVANVTVTAVDDNRITFNRPAGFPSDRIGGMTINSTSVSLYKSAFDKPLVNPFNYSNIFKPQARLWLTNYRENKLQTRFFTDRSGVATSAAPPPHRLETFTNPVVNGTPGDFRLPIIAQSLNTQGYRSYNLARDYLFDNDLSFYKSDNTLTSAGLNIAANGIYTITTSVTANVQFSMWGAGGGNFFSGQPNGIGGGGGFTTGIARLFPGRTYYIVVGQGGRFGANGNAIVGGGGSGGFGPVGYGGTGGGYTGIFANSISQTNAIMIAGGGGGAASIRGGAGGGTIGADGSSTGFAGRHEGGYGGTQAAGGAGGGGADSNGSAGSALRGGAAPYVGGAGWVGGGGGGGGYFGGGGGASGGGSHGAGAGGSGYFNANLVIAGNTQVGTSGNVANSNDVRRGTAGSAATDGRMIITVISLDPQPVRTISFPAQDKIPFVANSNVRIYNSLTRSKVEATVISADRGSVTVSANSVLTVDSQSSTLFIESAETSVFSLNEIAPTFGANATLPRNRLWYAQNFPSKFSTTSRIFAADPTLPIGLNTTQSNLATYTDQILFLYDANKPLYSVTSQTYQTSNTARDYIFDGDLTTVVNLPTTSGNVNVYFNNTDLPIARDPFPVGSQVVLYRNTPGNIFFSSVLFTPYVATVLESTSWYVKVPFPTGWDRTWQFYKIGKSTSDVYPKLAVSPKGAAPQSARENLFYSELARGYRYNLSRDAGIALTSNELPTNQGSWSGNTNNWFTSLSNDPTYSRLYYLQFSRGMPQSKTLHYVAHPGAGYISMNIGPMLTNAEIGDVTNPSLSITPSIFDIVNLQGSFTLQLELFSTAIEEYLSQTAKLYRSVTEKLQEVTVSENFARLGLKHFARGLISDEQLKNLNTIPGKILLKVSGTETQSPLQVGNLRLLIGGRAGSYVAVGQDANSIKVDGFRGIKITVSDSVNRSSTRPEFNVGMLNNFVYSLVSDPIRLNPYFMLFKNFARDPSKYTKPGALTQRFYSNQIQDVSVRKKDPVSFWS